MGEYHLQSVGPSRSEAHRHIDRKVAAILFHPKYDHKSKTFENDLALLRLEEPVKFQPNIIPVCMPEVEDEVGSKAWVTGFGRIYDGI